MTPQQKMNRVVALVRELQSEDCEAIVEARISGLAYELKVSAFQCGIIYWAMKAAPDFQKLYGKDVKVRVRPR